MGQSVLCAAVDRLRNEFSTLDWTYHIVEIDGQTENMFCWPGTSEEEIIIVVHQSGGRQELFHRHDYFYFNYTYQGEYDSISFKYDHVSPSTRANYMPDSRLPVTPSVFTTTKNHNYRRADTKNGFLPVFSANAFRESKTVSFSAGPGNQ